jgi:hypothetical protein
MLLLGSLASLLGVASLLLGLMRRTGRVSSP